MARYIKVNPLVAKFLLLENDRNQVKDGNYLLWQADMLAFGKLIDLPQILEQIGGISLQAHEAREEQDGTVIRELPTATDQRFYIEKTEEPAEVMPETPTEETEQPGDTTEAAPGEQDETPTPEASESEETETTNQENETV